MQQQRTGSVSLCQSVGATLQATRPRPRLEGGLDAVGTRGWPGGRRVCPARVWVSAPQVRSGATPVGRWRRPLGLESHQKVSCEPSPWLCGFASVTLPLWAAGAADELRTRRGGSFRGPTRGQDSKSRFSPQETRGAEVDARPLFRAWNLRLFRVLRLQAACECAPLPPGGRICEGAQRLLPGLQEGERTRFAVQKVETGRAGDGF